MSNDDELERLLREVDASLAGGTAAPKRGEVAKQPAASAPASRGRVGGAMRTGALAGLVCGAGVTAVSFFFSWLPLDQAPLNAGGGAFVGAFLTGTVLSLRGRA